MQLTFLKAKLHQAKVTHTEVDYEGSCAIDIGLLRQAHIREFEQIDIYNVTNGERFTTYAIAAEENSGIISLNGAAAHKASVSDTIIICAYAVLSQQELASFHPRLIYLNEENKVKGFKTEIEVQKAS